MPSIVRQLVVCAASLAGCRCAGVCDLSDGIHNRTCVHQEDGAYKLEIDSTCVRLKLSGALLGDDGAQALADALLVDEAPSLKSMELRDNDMSAAGASAIGRALRQGAGARLERLDLTGNRIGDDGAKAVAGAMRSAARLEGVALGGNGIGDVGAAAVASALGLAGLASLSLERNRVGDAGAEALAAALPLAKGLSELNLMQNAVGTRGALALASALERVARNGEPFLLGLTKNPAIGEEGLEALAKARKAQQTPQQRGPGGGAKGHDEL